MDARTQQAQRAAADLLPGGVTWLMRWLAIPSVSGSPRHRPDVAAAARLAAQRLRAYADTVTVVTGPAGPVVLARVRGRRPDRPAVLVYGHLDVKAPGPGWTGDPFRPRRAGERLIARGASDDKGQLLAHLLAVEGWVAVGGPPMDVLVVLDGAEEIGSPGLEQALRHPLLARSVGVVLVSDTRQARRGVPSLTVSQRGMVGLQVTVDAGGPPVHAGRFGGAVCDPSLVLVVALRRARGVVAQLPRDPVRAPAPDGPIRAAAGRAVVGGSLGERVGSRAALSVTSLRAGGTAGAVPRTAAAVVDVRLPPSAAPGPVRDALVRELATGHRPPLTVSVRTLGMSRGFLARHPEATLAALRRACVAGFGREPEPVASGGSIPAVVTLERAFGTSPVLLGFGAVDDGAHGPEEYVDLGDLARAVRTSVAFLGELPHKSSVLGSFGRCADSARHIHTSRHIGLGSGNVDRAAHSSLGYGSSHG